MQMIIFLKGECNSVFSSLCGWVDPSHGNVWENLGSVIFKTSALTAQSLKDSTNDYIFMILRSMFELYLLSFLKKVLHNYIKNLTTVSNNT